MPLFFANGHIVKVDRDLAETTEQLTERGYYVVKKKPDTEENYNKYVKESRVDRNKKYLGCKY